MKGKVYLVGAGPGNPGLITVKGLDCIRKADVLINDYLAPPSLLKHAPEHAEIIYVGKKAGDHTLSQDQISALIVEKAQMGYTVVRLKGGDPFIFGRGGEEAEALLAAGISFEIVPGVTSATAVPTYAGIPLTHRKYASPVAFVTGHEDPTKKESNIDWKALAEGVGTIVFLMGVKNLPNITRQLVRYGKKPDTPVAAIRWGTTPSQLTVVGTLETIVECVAEAGLTAPAIIVVGNVVELRETLKWYENRPLMGKTIVVTRALEQAGDLVDRLSELGAECLEWPTIKLVPPDDTKPIESAVERLAEYDWLVFTSANSVDFFFKFLFSQGRDVRALHHVRTAVVGPATAKKLFNFGLKSDIMPENYQAESVVKAFGKSKIKGEKILFPRAKEARRILPLELTKLGAVVDEVTVYHNQAVNAKADPIVKRLKEGTIDMITFTSSSTARNFHALLPAESFETLMKNVAIASIGPITADTAKQLGFDVDLVADPYTILGLCKAIQRYYTGQKSE